MARHCEVEINHHDRSRYPEFERATGATWVNKTTLLQEVLQDLPNVVLCPHIGSVTGETRIKTALMAAENILAALRGELPLLVYEYLSHS